MRKVFSGLAALLMLAVAVQFFLAASDAFDTAPTEEAFKSHRALGYGLLYLAVLLTVLAAVIRLPGRLIGLSGLVAGLMILQPVIAKVAEAFGDPGHATTAGKLMFGLHGLNAVVILVVLRNVMRQSRELATGTGGPAGGAPASGPAESSAHSAS
ncbi:DUF6220 domain-containing protein [Dactylosporangium sp. NBC_01737]|uniref:DUF6220 domain-containing protein n=1 Tax=Dactylosporangium sp. NBC_01737 TaxID=2975959 RepID=UPI002E0EE238|nr:DUF6220 domain-containing protein [Dactylosporangium sp. NBC_01737]